MSPGAASSARVRLVCGSSRSSRAETVRQFLDRFPRSCLLLTPSRGYANACQERLVRQSARGGAWGRSCWPFADFVLALLRQERIEVRPMQEFERRVLLESCLPSLDLTFLPLGNNKGPLPGLAAHLLAVVTGLKQAAIEPEEFLRRIQAARAVDPMDQLVAGAYAAYQRQLLSQHLYDVPGVYWEAHLVCQDRRPALLAEIRALAFDGFDDFTPSEFRLIQSLAPHVEEVCLGLNYDVRPDRQDLYVLPRRAAETAAKHFHVQWITCDEPEAECYTEFAVEHLFWRNKPPTARPVLRPNLTVMPCADLAHEIETVARRVKALILDRGVAPESIAIVFRNLDAVTPLLRAVLEECKIPFRLRPAVPLSNSTIGGLLLRWIQAASQWDTDHVLDLLMSPLLQGPDLLFTTLYPALARQAQLKPGYEEWVSGLQEFGERLSNGVREDTAALLARMPEAPRAAEALLKQIESLHRLWETLPLEGTQREHAIALDGILDGLSIEERLPHLAPSIRARESAAVAHLRALLETFAAGPFKHARLTRDQFLEQLRELLGEVEFVEPDTGGGVVCTDSQGVRNLQFDHVFLGGLNEGVMPAPPGVNAVYSESDLFRLRRSGVELEGRWEHGARERLLFQHVLLAARESLTLSWRLIQDGREGLPSHFLTEVEEIFKQTPVTEAHPSSDSFVATAAQVASERDLRNLVFFSQPAGFSWFPATCRQVEIERHRQESKVWDRYDGVLEDAGIVSWLHQTFGEEHVFSAAQLETYLECPFRFFMERVLRIEEPETPDILFDPRTRGSILHEVLRRFHQQHAGQPLSSLDCKIMQEELTVLLGVVFPEFARRDSAASPSLKKLEQLRLRRVLQQYAVITCDRQEDWSPRYFEVAFGATPREASDFISTPDYLILKSAGDVRLSGRIDRIDVQDNMLRIVDYKSGGVPESKQIKDGQNLQVTLYALAAEQLLLPGLGAVTEAVYLGIGKKTRSAAFTAKKSGVRAEIEAAAVEKLRSAVQGIRRGHFPPAPYGNKGCNGCGDCHACRFEQARVERRTKAVP